MGHSVNQISIFLKPNKYYLDAWTKARLFSLKILLVILLHHFYVTKLFTFTNSILLKHPLEYEIVLRDT